MARGQSLYDWCIKNGEWGQQLLQEFKGLDEHGNELNVNDLTYGSQKKVLWKCDKGHTWYAVVKSRTTQRRGCQQCSAEVSSVRNSTPKQGINDLYTWCLNNGEYGKQLLQEFQGIDEKGNKITPTEIRYGSQKKILWKCNKGHTWYATVSNRVVYKSGCPRCNYELQSIKRSTPTQGVNDLYTWCLNNGEWGQQLLQEWVGIDEDGNKVETKNILRGSSRKRVLWKCNKGHTWYATVAV